MLATTAKTSQKVTEILEKAQLGERISNEEALQLWRYGDFREMSLVAQKIRNQINPANQVSYTAFRVVNYTNFCNVECNFCSFMDEMESNKGYTLSIEEIIDKVVAAKKLDCFQLFLQGGVNSNLPFDWYLKTLSKIRKTFPKIHIRAFSPVEVLWMEKITGWTLEKVFIELKDAGMDSFPGAGAEILVDRMRDILSPKKVDTSEWYRAMRTAGECGLPSSTNIVWGSEETDHEIIVHLAGIRNLQDQTGMIKSFIPWMFQRQTKRFNVRYVSSQEYLKMVSLARIFLDNINHIEVSIMVAGKQLGELALFSGADDINSPVIEENVLRSFGLKSIAQSEKFIKQAGFIPIRRNLNFEWGKKS